MAQSVITTNQCIQNEETNKIKVQIERSFYNKKLLQQNFTYLDVNNENVFKRYLKKKIKSFRPMNLNCVKTSMESILPVKR